MQKPPRLVRVFGIVIRRVFSLQFLLNVWLKVGRVGYARFALSKSHFQPIFAFPSPDTRYMPSMYGSPDRRKWSITLSAFSVGS